MQAGILHCTRTRSLITKKGGSNLLVEEVEGAALVVEFGVAYKLFGIAVFEEVAGVAKDIMAAAHYIVAGLVVALVLLSKTGPSA